MDWVARALAEKTQHPHTFAITLTYGNDTQEQRDGAEFFRYSDIQLLLSRLRRHIAYNLGKTGTIRYLVAGEQGDRKKRCHWHMVLFSEVDLTTLGTYTAPWGDVTDREQIVSREGKPMRRRWSFWPHGFVVVQEPNEGGIKYALSYALKDQFAVDKAQWTGRESKSENLATGFFRMSKAPPIGWPYAKAFIDKIRETNSILPSLKIAIPDSKIQWYPRGAVRRLLLQAMRETNDKIAEQTGRNAPQWSTLISNLKDNPNDMEILLDVQEDEDEEGVEEAIRKRQADYDERSKRRRVVRRCGSSAACTACLRGHSTAKLADHGIEPYRHESGKVNFRYQGEECGDSLRRFQGDGKLGYANPLCGLRETDYVGAYLRLAPDRDQPKRPLKKG